MSDSHTFSRSSDDGRIVRIWHVQRLIDASSGLIPETHPVDDFRKWAEDQSAWNERMTMLDVVKHIQRVLAADMQYPIILAADGTVMDGNHRLTKAFLEGHTTIQVVQFPEDPAPDEVIELD